MSLNLSLKPKEGIRNSIFKKIKFTNSTIKLILRIYQLKLKCAFLL